MSDENPTPEEQREAEALARALEGSTEDAPRDALEVAALLGYAQGRDVADDGLLARARDAALEAKVLPMRRRRGRVMAGFLGTAAVAALALLSVMPPRMSAPEQSVRAPSAEAPEPAVAAEAPTRSSLARVLDAQADALARPELPLSALSEASAAHRRDLLASLSERYGGGP
jgi:hypothetical protein